MVICALYDVPSDVTHEVVTILVIVIIMRRTVR